MEIISNIMFIAVVGVVSFALTVISKTDKNNSQHI